MSFPLVQEIPEKPIKKDGLIAEEIEDEMEVIYVDSESGSSYALNTTASVVLDLCDGNKTQQDIAQVIAETVGLDVENVSKDVGSTLEEFMVLGLIR